ATRGGLIAVITTGCDAHHRNVDDDPNCTFRRTTTPGTRGVHSVVNDATGRGHWHPSAGASALRLDDDRHLGRHAREDLDSDLVGAQRLDRLLEIDLVLVDHDPAPAERLGDVLVVDRPVEL